MMTLEKAKHGFTCVMSGVVSEADIDGYLEEAKRLLVSVSSGRFGLIVDQRECRLLAEVVQVKLGDVIKLFRSRGLDRVAIVCPTSVMAMQMNRIAAGSGAAGVQFALNGSDSQWMQKALAWVDKGITS